MKRDERKLDRKTLNDARCGGKADGDIAASQKLVSSFFQHSSVRYISDR
jgi:hypothetical protein